MSKIVDQKEYVMTWNQEGNALNVNELFYWKILSLTNEVVSDNISKGNRYIS